MSAWCQEHVTLQGMEGIDLGFFLLRFEDIGYLAIFAVMLLDGANVPFTPNELFLGFIGYLARTGGVNPAIAYLVAMLGTMTGHAFSFFVGWKVGRPLFDRYGKFILVTNDRLDAIEKRLKQFGPTAPFVARFIPGLRNVGSLLMGVFQYPPGPFFILTAAGVAIYNALFFMTGFILAERFAAVGDWIVPIMVCVLAVGLALAAIHWYRMRRSVQPSRAKRRRRTTRR
ncbi:MAG: DedA family protein [Patescibacteria group bacterium]